ncbi:immunoglobulin domain-containing protein [Pseudarcicella hirudinis]|uniref:immunoglobulin domain-containing protein n=2 Tax=Pseudarcicella hirudinis TaxID=1079859 RepID=UPI00406BC8C0
MNQAVENPIASANITKTAVVCELCCKVEADAGSNSPIQNCTSGQITLNTGASTTGTDVTYSWEGPNQFKSNMKSPIISGDLSKAAGIYTLTVTRSNSSCEAKDIATTEVILDCTCPFTVNTNGTTTGPLNCYETIFLKANCQGCSTGTIAAGAETWAANGQFSNGDTGFGCEALNHFITANPNNIDGSFNFFGDHTGNIGANNMLLVGHSENREEKVWYQTVTVKPNTRYILSAWVAGAYNNNPNKVFFNIDGQSLPEKIDLSSTPGGQWVKLQSVWISGTATSVVFAIRKENTQGHNWFALDDISISEAPKAEFVWTGPNGFSATGKNQFIRNVALKNSGTYTLKVTDKGCTNYQCTNYGKLPHLYTTHYSNYLYELSGFMWQSDNIQYLSHEWFCL